MNLLQRREHDGDLRIQVTGDRMSSRLHPEDTALLIEPETGESRSKVWLQLCVLSVKSPSRRNSESQNADFMLIKIIARICITLIRRSAQRLKS